MAGERVDRTALTRRVLIKSIAAGLAAPALLRARAALAAYPDRPVRIVVANSPGGPSDIIARIMASALQEKLSGSFVVENKGGAGGNIGMGYVARAENDGYTLLLATSVFAVNPGLYKTLPYDPFKDFVAICELAASPNLFSARPELGVSNMKEFVALAKANPEKFNVSVPPVGTTPQLEAEVLKFREGLPKMASIVFGGGGEALQALLSGTVQLSSGTIAPAMPFIKAGTIRGLAICSENRWPDLPDVPTMQEQGYKDFVFDTYTALMAPTGTPPEAVSRIEQEALAILARPDMRALLAQSGFEIRAKSGKEHMARVAREVPMFADIITQAGIKKL
ncbi:MAG: ABC transporter substrate-binding protein [Xanthobacteraceae bacterium]|nr:ABC transporter substrate-binding protein [Xanthobacteraceae bacterium]